MADATKKGKTRHCWSCTTEKHENLPWWSFFCRIAGSTFGGTRRQPPSFKSHKLRLLRLRSPLKLQSRRCTTLTCAPYGGGQTCALNDEGRGGLRILEASGLGRSVPSCLCVKIPTEPERHEKTAPTGLRPYYFWR